MKKRWFYNFLERKFSCLPLARRQYLKLSTGYMSKMVMERVKLNYIFEKGAQSSATANIKLFTDL